MYLYNVVISKTVSFKKENSLLNQLEQDSAIDMRELKKIYASYVQLVHVPVSNKDCKAHYGLTT